MNVNPTKMYPRLIQRYGGEVVFKSLIKPCRKNRQHALVGQCTYESYGFQLNYKHNWKETLRKRSEQMKPQRDLKLGVKTVRNEPHVSAADLSMRENIVKSLSSIRQPQLHEFYVFTDAQGKCVNEVIGQGVEGTIRCARRLDAEEDARNVVAVKSINKIHSHMFRSKDSPIMREVTVLERLKAHPNIIKMIDVFESPVKLHIVTEYLPGGDLHNYLQDRDFETASEDVVKDLVAKLLGVLKFCLAHDVVHLDIKLENVLRRSRGEEIGEIVLIDFGHSKKIPKQTCPHGVPTAQLSRPVGSPSYAAPEIVLKKQYNTNSDMWSLGVLAYIFLQGYLPFPHLQMKPSYEFVEEDYRCEQNDPFCYENEWEHLSSDAKSFIESLLRFKPEERLSVDTAMKHPWLNGCAFEEHFPAQEEPSVSAGVSL